MISEFYKMSGGGNDFIIIDNTDNSVPESKASFLAEKLCKRQLSVGADGLILICSSDEDDFKWMFYNSDGSKAEMCGNGARCAARFAYLKGIAGRSMTFGTLAGKIKAEIVDEDSVKVLMTPPLDAHFDYLLEVEKKCLKVSSVNTGVPHVVIKSENLDEEPLVEVGRKIRFHDNYSPAGTNVNFYEIIGDSNVAMRTYERGVEGETLACGTGAVAVAIVANTCENIKFPVKIKTRSGATLIIHKEDNNFFLEGEARIIYQGILNNEAFKY